MQVRMDCPDKLRKICKSSRINTKRRVNKFKKNIYEDKDIDDQFDQLSQRTTNALTELGEEANTLFGVENGLSTTHNVISGL